jgi:hypothetical protein
VGDRRENVRCRAQTFRRSREITPCRHACVNDAHACWRAQRSCCAAIQLCRWRGPLTEVPQVCGRGQLTENPQELRPARQVNVL